MSLNRFELPQEPPGASDTLEIIKAGTHRSHSRSGPNSPELLTNPGALKLMSKAAESLAIPDAAEQVTAAILEGGM